MVDQAYFVFDGQSNTLYPFYAEAYPTKLMNRRFAGQPYRVVAQGGTDFPERSATAAERTDSWVGTRPQTVLFNEGGPSDLLRGASGAQVFDRARRYVQDRRAAGFAIVIGVTVPPSTAYTPAMEQARLDYNARLRSDCYGAGLDVLVDVAAIRELQDPSDLRYYSDGAHFTSAATDLVAARYLAALP